MMAMETYLLNDPSLTINPVGWLSHGEHERKEASGCGCRFCPMFAMLFTARLAAHPQYIIRQKMKERHKI
jgi:hypothetical protein